MANRTCKATSRDQEDAQPMPRVSVQHLAARRQQILDAALTCFDRSGFHRTSMQDIFGEAQLSAGAVYRYFASKEDIVEAIAEQRHAKEAELIAQAAAIADPGEALRRLADLYFEWLTDPDEQRRRRVGVQIWAEAVHNERLRSIVLRGTNQRQLLAVFLRDAQQHGRLPFAIDPDALTRIYLALFQGFILQQAWESDIDVHAYLQALKAIVDATMPRPSDN
jgi:TetR/AcrR family transcriptional regulator, repressor for uid operon